MSAITWTSTPTMATIKLPSGNVYYLKDAEVRTWIGTGSGSGAEYRITSLESAVAALSNATHWLGITTTALTDGATTNPITINDSSVTAVNGDIVQYNNNEFIFNGTAWQEFGAGIGILKAFAYVDQGTATFTPAGSNSSSSVSFSGTQTDKVLGEDTTFTAADSAVTFTGNSTDNFVKSYPGATSKLVTTTVTPVSSMPSFAMDSTDAEMLVITNGSAGSAVTVATGALASNGAGASVMTGLGTASTGSAITELGTGTAAAQAITVGTNDRVTAVTNIGTATAAAQTFTGTQQTIDVDPKSTT